jgi:anti-sigma regulatory factor (Ser/Thr protein kinase)
MRSFEAHPASLARIRMFVRELAERGEVPPEVTSDLLLAVSEACANAVLHSGSPRIEVEWLQQFGRVHIGVRDEGVFLPEDERKDRAPTARLGLYLMQATVDRVLVEPGTPHRPGTVVWLEKSLHNDLVPESA